MVVVSHDRVELLRRCLESLEKSEGRQILQLILVDNGSTDGSAQLESEFPNIQFIRLPKNFGLTKALNIGWRAADAAYVFFLHDDTEVEPGTVLRLADVLDANPDAAATCPLLVDGAGNPAPQLDSLPPTGHWRPAQPASAEPFSVDYPRGAAFMMRVLLIKSIRQIDEHYGQFGSDADLATQIRGGGKKILLVPGTPVRHYGRDAYTALERADYQLSRAVYRGKYEGFAAGILTRIGAVAGSLVSLRLGEMKHTLSGQKIDGTQP